ncbi:hypothetical protein SLEP1_g49834 [Rubroshorea leprosula]|uniref:Uncharacterized protein n=1 Tax=Rubroshorea leprosula TaxID=152421 RepID=A0AAV5M147_9ROSI|nr:hypothetical protein SLEP1_g49834 [Rubroshorea leprosula]
MANLSPSFCLLLLVLIFISERRSSVNAGCTYAVPGGGCPDVQKCLNDVCRPCYRGVGRIEAVCRAAGGGIPFDECLCIFKNGAPCNPPAPPKCPGPPAVVTRIIHNQN